MLGRHKGPNTAFAVFYIMEGVIGTLLLGLVFMLAWGGANHREQMEVFTWMLLSIPGFMMQVGYALYLARVLPRVVRVGMWGVSLLINVYTAIACVLIFGYMLAMDHGFTEAIPLVVVLVCNSAAIVGLGVWALVREVRAQAGVVSDAGER